MGQASADLKIVQSKRAVEIETLKAQAEVQPLIAPAAQLGDLKKSGAGALNAYVRNVRLILFSEAKTVVLELDYGWQRGRAGLRVRLRSETAIY